MQWSICNVTTLSCFQTLLNQRDTYDTLALQKWKTIDQTNPSSVSSMSPNEVSKCGTDFDLRNLFVGYVLALFPRDAFTHTTLTTTAKRLHMKTFRNGELNPGLRQLQ